MMPTREKKKRNLAKRAKVGLIVLGIKAGFKGLNFFGIKHNPVSFVQNRILHPNRKTGFEAMEDLFNQNEQQQ